MTDRTKPMTKKAIIWSVSLSLTGAFLFILIFGIISFCKEMQIIDAVEKFADTVITHGRDNYGEEHTPLFVDVLNIETLRSPNYFPKGTNGAEWHTVLSNFAYQQNLLRVLVGLSNLTGEDKYRREAEKTAKYMFDHCWDKDSGLFYWGTHRYWDMETEEALGEKGSVHELKRVYPFYDFLYEVDPEKTELLIKGIWNAHILDWSNLTFNRHGAYEEFDSNVAWDHDWNGSTHDTLSEGLTFFNAGSDLIYAGFWLSIKTQEKKPSLWANRLFEQFAKGRDNTTFIMPHLSAREKNRERGKLQFHFPNAFEPNLYIGNEAPIDCLGHCDFSLLHLGERLKKAGRKVEGSSIIKYISEHLIGYAKYAYDHEKNIFKPIIIDGTDLTGYQLPEDGYFGPKGKTMETVEGDANFLPVYALAFRLQGSKELWDTLRSLSKGNSLGDIGKDPGDKPQLDYSCTTPSPRIIFAFVEIYKATLNREYLNYAEHICKNILQKRYNSKSGLFTIDKNHLACHLDCYEPLALLTVAAAKKGKLHLIPSWNAGGSYPGTHSLIVSGYSMKAEYPKIRKFVVRRKTRR